MIVCDDTAICCPNGMDSTLGTGRRARAIRRRARYLGQAEIDRMPAQAGWRLHKIAQDAKAGAHLIHVTNDVLVTAGLPPLKATSLQAIAATAEHLRSANSADDRLVRTSLHRRDHPDGGSNPRRVPCCANSGGQILEVAGVRGQQAGDAPRRGQCCGRVVRHRLPDPGAARRLRSSDAGPGARGRGGVGLQPDVDAAGPTQPRPDHRGPHRRDDRRCVDRPCGERGLAGVGSARPRPDPHGRARRRGRLVARTRHPATLTRCHLRSGATARRPRRASARAATGGPAGPDVHCRRRSPQCRYHGLARRIHRRRAPHSARRQRVRPRPRAPRVPVRSGQGGRISCCPGEAGACRGRRHGLHRLG